MVSVLVTDLSARPSHKAASSQCDSVVIGLPLLLLAHEPELIMWYTSGQGRLND